MDSADFRITMLAAIERQIQSAHSRLKPLKLTLKVQLIRMPHMDTPEEKSVDAETPIDEASENRANPEQAEAGGECRFCSTVMMRLNHVWLWAKRHRHPLLALVVFSLSAANIPHVVNWLRATELTARPLDVSYALKDEWAYPEAGSIKFKKGVSYFAKTYLKALNKTYHVHHVRVFIVLKTGEFKEGRLHPSFPPAPNSDTLDIQHLRCLEKDRDYLCYVNFFLEGEQKDTFTEMTFERIELRLYSNVDRFKKVDLYESDFPEF